MPKWQALGKNGEGVYRGWWGSVRLFDGGTVSNSQYVDDRYGI